MKNRSTMSRTGEMDVQWAVFEVNKEIPVKGVFPVKSVNLIVLALVAISSLLVLPAWSQGGNVEQQINTLTDQVVQALLKGDTSFFEKYYADDAMIIRGPGAQYTKAQEIEFFKSGANKFEAYDVRERKIHTYGDTAVASMEASAKGSGNGQPFSGDYRVTRVWVKEKGNWKLVLYQVSPIAGASHQ